MIQNERGDCILWVDFRRDATLDPCAEIEKVLPICRIRGGADLSEAISLHRPLFLCFDFDQPDKKGLLALQETKRTHSHLPILMLTEHHSAELEIWALRNRVWDYLVKPLAPELVEQTMRSLMRVSREFRATPRRSNLHFQQTVLSGPGLGEADNVPKQKTRPAVAYMAAHLDRTITRQYLAALCHQSQSSFSKAFKQEHGTPFSKYLLQLRLDKACDLLDVSTASIKEITYAAGFHNTTYFDRAFRGRYGIAPGAWRAAKHHQPDALK